MGKEPNSKKYSLSKGYRRAEFNRIQVQEAGGEAANVTLRISVRVEQQTGRRRNILRYVQLVGGFHPGCY